MTTIRATRIVIDRAEGPSNLCGSVTFDGDDCWERAGRWLSSQSDTYPRNGGYDKHDFKVVFADGYEYEGRLDCKHRDCDDADLDVRAHVRDFISFYAGRRRPDHMTAGEYEETLKMLHRRLDTTRAEYEEFLEAYDV